MDTVDALSTKIEVLIADDHEMVRRGLSTFLRLADDLEVVGQASCGVEAVRLARKLRPRVVLMDLMMPGLDGVAAIRALREAVPETRVIALTSFHTEEMVVEALRAGATSYLLKDIGAVALVDAIRAACAGQPTLAPQAAEAVLKHRRAPRAGQGLSRREREVLSLMVRGFTNRQIAEHLSVARGTANVHVSNILGKLGVQSRTKAVARAIQDQLVA
jgi:NarL family two-component system response regulator LiaR